MIQSHALSSDRSATLDGPASAAPSSSPIRNDPIVIFAPHAGHPPMDGASYRSWSIAREASRTNRDCYYFTKEDFFKVSPEGTPEKIDAVRSRRGKNWSALRALLRGSHYLKEKHLPEAWTARAREWLKEIKPGVLVVSFLWAWDEGWSEPPATTTIYLDTHNYDPEWWDNLRRSGRNRLSRRVCDLSRAYALKKLAELPAGLRLLHVSANDQTRYRQHRPDLQHLVLANGCDVQFRDRAPDYAATRKSLYFLGALNIRISLDALRCFAERFWPALKDTAEMHVFGSGATGEARAICAAHGWNLHEDLTDEALAKEFRRMHYLVLPFSYSAGSKLKLINACGKGIPVVTTRHGAVGFDALPPTVVVSEDAAGWAAAIARPTAPTDAELRACRKFAERFSWQGLVTEAGILENTRA